VDRSTIRWLLPWALPLALIGALAYFFLAPMPPEKILMSGASRRVDVPAWKEWRTPEFFDERAALDRSHPIEVLHAIFEAFRAHEHQRVLAYSTHRLQHRFTPEQLGLREDLGVGFTAWTEIHVDSIEPRDQRVLIRGRSVIVDQTMYFRAALRAEDGGWALDSLRMSPSEDDPDISDRARSEESPPPAIVTPRHPAPTDGASPQPPAP